MMRERTNRGASFKSHNLNPCPSCFMWNTKQKKCVPQKGCFCKVTRCKI